MTTQRGPAATEHSGILTPSGVTDRQRTDRSVTGEAELNATRASAPADPQSGRRSPSVVVVAVVVLGLIVPLVLARHYGALGIPRSDDWSYLVTLFRLVDSGRLSFNHWVSMHLVGQLALSAPLAAIAPRDIAAQQCLTLALGGVALATTALTARELGLGVTARVLAVTGLAASPFWGPLAVSYMTDIPALAFTSLATWLAVRAFRRDRPRSLLLGAVAAAWVATAIRQYAVVTLVVVLVVALAESRRRGDRSDQRCWVVVGVVAIAAFLLLDAWWRTVPDGRTLAPGAPTELGGLVTTGAGLLRVIGLCVLPALCWSNPVGRLRRAWSAAPVTTLVVAGGTAAWLAVTAARTPRTVFVGNYVMRRGVLDDIVLIGRRPDVLPGPVWGALVLGATAAAVVLVTLLVTEATIAVRRRSSHPIDPARTVLRLIVGGYLAAYAVAAVTDVQIYDRYALAVIGPAGLLLLADAAVGRRRTTARVLTALTATVLVMVAIAFTADSASYDGARWRLATAVTRLGWPARTVNGGFEWRNFHRGDKLPAHHRTGELICVTVHSDPVRRPAVVVATRRSSAPTRGDLELVAFRTDRACPGVKFRR